DRPRVRILWSQRERSWGRGPAQTSSSSPDAGSTPTRTRQASPLRAVDGQNDVPGLLLRFDVPGRVDHVFQRVGPIDDRPVLPSLDELLEEDDVLLGVSRWYLEDHFPVSDPRGPQRQDEIQEPVGW